jgi:hypothetical protein
MSTHPTRREFVSSSAAMFSNGWLLLNLPVLTSLAACAPDAARNEEPFVTFTPEEGRTFRAFAARILPSVNGLPGAEEAGVAWFADKALAGPMAGMLEPLRASLPELDRQAQAAHGVQFASTTETQQDAVIGQLTSSPVFGLGRTLVIFGMFAHPSNGGNRDHAGFKLVQMDHEPSHTPPFGYYDAEHVRVNGGAS